MIKLIISLVFILINTGLTAQIKTCPRYDSSMSEGNRLLKDSSYDKALKEFQAAQIAARECKLSTTEATTKIKETFTRIASQRDTAIKLRTRAENALEKQREADSLRKTAEAATKQAEEETNKARDSLRRNLRRPDSLIVIANEQGAPHNLPLDSLKSAIMGETLRWKDPARTKINICLLRLDSDVGWLIAEKIFKTRTKDKLLRYFRLLEYQGMQYRFFNSVSELEIFVSKTPGAIGVIDRAPALTVNRIRIDGYETLGTIQLK